MSCTSTLVVSSPRVVSIAFIALLSSVLAGAQPAQPPRFQSGTTALQLTVTVVDSQGQAVSDLGPEDFEVDIDGARRKVLFARFSGGDVRRDATAPHAVLSNRVDRPGRAVVFVVDLESIKAGYERPLLETAARLAESLADADAVSVVPFPGRAIDLTRDRARVASAIRQLRGANSEPFYEYFVSMEEAAGFERGDKRIISEVTQRECRAGGSFACPDFVKAEALQRLASERSHVQFLLSAVTDIARRLGEVAAPRTLVLVSGGLGFETDGLTYFSQVGRAVKAAGINLYAVHLEQPDVEGATPLHGPTRVLFSRDRQLGLANVASASGGQLFYGIGTASGAFDRMRNEIAHAYLLGVEIEPGAANIVPERVRVRANRPGVRVRAIVQETAARREPLQRLRTLMQQPIDASDFNLSAMLYCVRGEEPDTLKAILTAEIGREGELESPVRYALAVLNGDQRVYETDGVATTADEGTGLNLAWQIAPGAYRLRLAAVDAKGRGGSLDAPISIGLRSAADVQTSDLMLSASASSFQPAFVVPAGTPVTAALEMYSTDVQRLDQAKVHFEIRRQGEDAILAAIPAQFSETSSERRRLASADFATLNLSPSEYSVSAVLALDGRPIGKTSRSVRVTAATATSREAALRRAASGAMTDKAEDTAELPASGAPVATDPELNEVLRRMGAYVANYGPRASLVVAVEKYTQFVEAESIGQLRPRQLVAEFALVRTSGSDSWIGFRDVVEVDGQAVQDRRDRLLRLFTTADEPLPEATRIANESARFNVGPISRNFNVPTMALLLFTPANLARFSFDRKGTDRIDGVDAWEIAFKETARPTLVMTRAGKDVPCEGTLWVIPSDGTVVRTRVRLRRFADAFAMSDPQTPAVPATGWQPSPAMMAPPSPPPAPASGGGGSAPSSGQGGNAPSGGSGQSGSGSSGGGGNVSTTSGGGGGDERPRAAERTMMEFPDFRQLESRADIEVTYRRDPALDIWLPARMSEEYSGPIPRTRTAPLLGSSRTIATYGDYRQFDTSSKIVVPR